MNIVVGLGNPGRTYDRTRHNVGFEVLDELARRYEVRFRRGLLGGALKAKVRLETGEELLLVKPQTYMNLSGTAVAPLMRKTGTAPGDLIVVLDDAELPLGCLRIRKKGSAGSHNGLKSVIASVGTDEIVRVRVGIGRHEGGGDLTDHVLSPFGSGDRRIAEEAMARAADAVTVIAAEGADQAMNRFNG